MLYLEPVVVYEVVIISFERAVSKMMYPLLLCYAISHSLPIVALWHIGRGLFFSYV